MNPSSWLFVRGEESIRVVRPDIQSLIVLGPGPLRDIRDFRTGADVEAYQIQLAERLSELGWILLGADVDRRRGVDRRQQPRKTADRRQATAPRHGRD
jgi:hypothetical protein